MEIIEEKINYDGKIDRVKCLLLRKSTKEVVLLYRISKKYKTDEFALPIGSLQ